MDKRNIFYDHMQHISICAIKRRNNNNFKLSIPSVFIENLIYNKVK